MLFYNTTQRTNPVDPEGPKKWHPVLKRIDNVKENELVKKLAFRTTLDAKEAAMAIGWLETIISELLLDGKTVHLGTMGYLKLAVKTTGVDEEKDVTAHQIDHIYVRFTPSKEFRKHISDAKFAPVESLSNK